MLLSVPVELSTDHFELLAAAQEEGYISEELLANRSAWPVERFRQVVNVLLLEGIVWVDDHRGAALVFLYSLILLVVDERTTLFLLCAGSRRFEFPSMQS